MNTLEFCDALAVLHLSGDLKPELGDAAQAIGIERLHIAAAKFLGWIHHTLRDHQTAPLDLGATRWGGDLKLLILKYEISGIFQLHANKLKMSDDLGQDEILVLREILGRIDWRPFGYLPSSFSIVWFKFRRWLSANLRFRCKKQT